MKKIRLQVKVVLLTCLCIVCLNSRSQDVKNAFPRIDNFQNLKSVFLSPPNEYAPHSFWFWNDSLDTEKSSYMACEMATKGMNPGYIHPRHYEKTVGLPIDQWLSDEYFDCIEDVLEICDSTNTYLGFCDEYWWPSGRVGGNMVAKYPKMQAKELSWEQWKVNGPWKVILPPNEFIVACCESEPGIIDTKTLKVISTGGRKEWTVPQGEWVLYIFNVISSPSRGRGPDRILVNYMEPELHRHFIEMGLKPYEKHLKKYMGKSLRYCFSDNEGEYGNRLPWSKFLISFYEELYDDDIRKWMPLLFTEDVDGKWVTARYRWFNMVSEMYAHKFWKPINDWLAKRGLYYISNFWEANLMIQAATVGDYFRVNRAFSFPGNDCLNMDARNLEHFKEIQSICEFEHRPFMSEIMGVKGWQQTPAEMKEVANLATAWGVTQIVPHGVNLNRDIKNCIHPADWFTDNPYWQVFEQWTSFCKRASMINKQGKLATDFLIYNPMVSIWSLSDKFLSGRATSRYNWGNKKGNEINAAYYGVQKALSKKNIEYLIADDALIHQSELVGKGLKIRDHNFKTLCLPPLYTVKTEVYQKILEFALAGGRVILLGDLPVSSAENGLNDPVISQINWQLRSCPNIVDCSGENIHEVCEKASLQAVSVMKMLSGNFKLHSSHRIIDGKHFYWLSNNTGKKQSCSFHFKEGAGNPEKWNCETGKITRCATSIKIENAITLDFDPYEGFWLVFSGESKEVQSDNMTEDTIKLQDSNWRVIPDDKTINFSTADVFCGKGEIKNPFEIEEKEWIHQKITCPLNIYGEWETDWIRSRILGEYGYFIYDFNLQDDPQNAILNLSLPKGSKIYVNSRNIQFEENNSWKEPVVLNIVKYLERGNNRIAIRTGKYLKPGDYWMLAQGEVNCQDGSIVNIGSGTGWQKSEMFTGGWQKPGCHLKNASEARVVPWKKLMWTYKDEVHLPTKNKIPQNEVVSLRFNVPPGARSFMPGINMSEVDVWVDAQKTEAKNGLILLEEGAGRIYLKAPKRTFNFAKPLVFECKQSTVGSLKPWLEWGLDRYSGFVEYEQEMVLGDSVEKGKTTLHLGTVKYVAEVFVNGQRVGARMWEPFDFDISSFVVPGENKISIRVGNLIANKMAMYDDFGQLYRWGNYGVPDIQYLNAGMLGPVYLSIRKRKD